jgi:pumilio homology domain family member 6
VTKLIRLCPSHRASILLEFQSHVLRLLLHREASSVLADAFELYANAYERTILVRDFYGKETSLFSVTTGSEQDKLRAKAGLFGVLEGVDDERRKRVLNAMKDNLFAMWVAVSAPPSRGLVSNTCVDSITRTKVL